MRLLIVDDEAVIRQGIIARIEFLDLEVNEIRQADCAKEALSLLNQHPSDILMTDIKMPGMNGLELIREAKKKIPQIKCIILSGYGEFEYAKEAIDLSVHQYLLKPISNEEFKKAYLSLVEEIKREEELRRWRHKRAQLLQYHNDIELEREVNLYLSGQIQSKETYPHLYEKCLEWIDGSTSVYTCILQIEEETYQDSQFDKSNIGLLHFLIKNVVEEISPDLIKKIFVNLSHGQQMWIIIQCEEKGEEKIQRFYEHLKEVLSDGFAITFSLGVSLGEGNLSYEGLQKATKALSQRILRSASHLYWYQNEQVDDDYMLGDVLKELDHCIEIGNVHQINEWLKTYLNPTFIRHQGIHYLTQICDQVMGLLIQKSGPKQVGWAIERLKALPQLGSIEERKEVLYKCIVETLSKKDFSQLDSKTKMHLAVEYIEEHYHEDISINGMAEAFDMSPNYFSSLFKKEIGSSTVHYITALRIEKAKHYLTTSNLSVVDIAKRVGYEDSQYFFKVFKKQENTSPLQYRQKYRK